MCMAYYVIAVFHMPTWQRSASAWHRLDAAWHRLDADWYRLAPAWHRLATSLQANTPVVGETCADGEQWLTYRKCHIIVPTVGNV